MEDLISKVHEAVIKKKRHKEKIAGPQLKDITMRRI